MCNHLESLLLQMFHPSLFCLSNYTLSSVNSVLTSQTASHQQDYCLISVFLSQSACCCRIKAIYRWRETTASTFLTDDVSLSVFEFGERLSGFLPVCLLISQCNLLFSLYTKVSPSWETWSITSSSWDQSHCCHFSLCQTETVCRSGLLHLLVQF